MKHGPEFVKIIRQPRLRKKSVMHIWGNFWVRIGRGIHWKGLIVLEKLQVKTIPDLSKFIALFNRDIKIVESEFQGHSQN